MKKYKAVVYENDIKSTHIIYANNLDEALELAWEKFDADDIYVTGVED